MMESPVDNTANPFIQYVRKDDPPFLFHRGEGFERHKLPTDTRVILPKPPVPGIPDVQNAIENALDNPLGYPPLSEILTPGMKITIAFDDISLPLPPMRKPDIRHSIMEAVLNRLERAGIDDIEFICAICLHRRLTPAELKHIVGPRIFNQYWPDRLYNHDAEDPTKLITLGTTDHGEDVELNRRAVESDLLIYVNINLVTMDGGHKSVPVGLGTYKSVRHHHNVRTMMTSNSYMDPATSSFHKSCDRMGKIVADRLKIFTIETTLNSDTFSPLLGFLQTREAEWSAFDHLNYQFNRTLLKTLPAALRNKFYFALPAPYGLTGIHAGMTGPVHEKTIPACHEQQLVDVDGQADILLVGLPEIGPYSVYSTLNPILVYCMAAGYFFNFYKGKPLLREGGVMIVDHPMHGRFNKTHHPSYIDFFNDILPQTIVPSELEQQFEKAFAENERYIHLYRTSYAYHGVHPFYMWYWGCHGMAHMGKVISVNPQSPESARRIGFDTAPSMNTAIDQAKEFLGLPGTQAKITYFHCPPVLMCNVT
jgi:lactate racemase-like protein